MRHSNIVSYKLRINGWDMNVMNIMLCHHSTQGKHLGGNLFNISELGQGEEMIIIIWNMVFFVLHI